MCGELGSFMSAIVEILTPHCREVRVYLDVNSSSDVASRQTRRIDDSDLSEFYYKLATAASWSLLRLLSWSSRFKILSCRQRVLGSSRWSSLVRTWSWGVSLQSRCWSFTGNFFKLSFELRYDDTVTRSFKFEDFRVRCHRDSDRWVRWSQSYSGY